MLHTVRLFSVRMEFFTSLGDADMGGMIVGAAFVSDFVSDIIYAHTVVAGTGVPCGDAGAIGDCVPNWLHTVLLVPRVDAEMASVNLTVMSSAAIASLPDNFEVTAACPVGVGTLWKAMIGALALGFFADGLKAMARKGRRDFNQLSTEDKRAFAREYLARGGDLTVADWKKENAEEDVTENPVGKSKKKKKKKKKKKNDDEEAEEDEEITQVIAAMTEGGAATSIVAIMVEALPQLVYTIAIEFFVKRDAFRECNRNLRPSLSAGRSEFKRTH